MRKIIRILKAICWLAVGTQAERRRVRLELARITSSIFGDFPLSEDHKLWRDDKDFLDAYKRLSPDNPYSQDRKFVLREWVRYTRDVPGAISECGCYEGASAWFIASEAGHTPLLLFDSFAGLSQPSEVDVPNVPDSIAWAKGDLSASEEKIRVVLGRFPSARFFKGWIPERFAEVSGLRFRLVHIDVDLYQPTLDALRFFYPRMSENGVIVLDDYGFTTCPGVHKAVSEYMLDKKEHVVHLPTGQGIIITLPKSA